MGKSENSVANLPPLSVPAAIAARCACLLLAVRLSCCDVELKQPRGGGGFTIARQVGVPYTQRTVVVGSSPGRSSIADQCCCQNLW
jgi:hypothetical protein